jgi:AraC family transcriptional activator of pobA
MPDSFDSTGSLKNSAAAVTARRPTRQGDAPGGVDTEIRVFALSEWRQHDSFELRLTSRESRQLIFVYSGVGSIALDGNNFETQPGTVIAVPSGTVCTMQLAPDSEGICVRIKDAYFYSQIVTSLPVFARHSMPYWQTYYTPMIFTELAGENNRRRRNEVMCELLKTRERLGLGCDPAVTAFMLVIMFEPQLHTHQMPTRSQNESSAQMSARGLVLEFRSLIEKNFARHLPLQGYCALLNVTQRRLSQMCLTTMGVKPLALIHQRVILEAKRELLYSSKTVAEIASALGFEDVSYFSRFVKHHTGKSPISFRR